MAALFFFRKIKTCKQSRLLKSVFRPGRTGAKTLLYKPRIHCQKSHFCKTKAPLRFLTLFLCTTLHSPAGQLGVFLLCRLSSAQVPLLLVFVQHGFHLVVQQLVHLLQPYRYVLVHRAFAYPEMFRRRADCRIVFNYIMSECDTSFLICFPFCIFLQFNSHPRRMMWFSLSLSPQRVCGRFFFTFYEKRRGYITCNAALDSHSRRFFKLI